MLRAVLLVILAVIGAFLAYVATLSPTLEVERHTAIDAPPEAVFAHIADLRQWEAWSPWAKRDPNAKTSYSGPASGVGAIYEWDGNDEVGKGQLEITQSRAPEYIALRLTFIEPFPGESHVEFHFTPAAAANGTDVRWTLNSTQPFLERAITTLMGLDIAAMIGADYETGLASLKRVVEAQEDSASGVGGVGVDASQGTPATLSPAQPSAQP